MGIRNIQGTPAHIVRLKKDYDDYYKSCCPNFEEGFCTLYTEFCSHVNRCKKYLPYLDKNKKKLNNKKKSTKAIANTKSPPIDKSSIPLIKDIKPGMDYVTKASIRAKRANKKNKKKQENNIKNINQVHIGSCVKIKDLEADEEFLVKVVNEKTEESHTTPKQPLGKAIINKMSGDIVDVYIERYYTKKFKILEIT